VETATGQQTRARGYSRNRASQDLSYKPSTYHRHNQSDGAAEPQYDQPPRWHTPSRPGYSPLTPGYSPLTPEISPLTLDNRSFSSPPVSEAGGSLPSLQEDVHESTSLKPPNISPLRGMIVGAVRTIYDLDKYSSGVPREVYAMILQALRQNHAIAPETLWSDGAMWRRTLDAGSTTTQMITILNLLGYMGAWQWYDGQVKKLSKAKSPVEVSPKTAATRVLNRIQYKQVRGLGAISLEDGTDTSAISPAAGETNITQSIKKRQRNRIKTQLSRGQKLSLLVERLGFGVLFDSNIRYASAPGVPQLLRKL
jgi:hypothetical protein